MRCRRLLLKFLDQLAGLNGFCAGDLNVRPEQIGDEAMPSKKLLVSGQGELGRVVRPPGLDGGKRAVQAIHSTNTCATQEDQDSENEADNDKDEHETTRSNTTNTNTVTFTETDAKAIADDATTRMTAAFNDAKTKLAALPASAPKKETNSHRTSTEHPEGHD